MKKLILAMVFVFAIGTMMNANNLNEEVYADDCYDAASHYVNSLDWDSPRGQDRALEVYEVLLDLCDL